MALDTKLIKDSFELAKPISDKLVKRFYENLYSDYPQSKSLYLDGQLPESQLAILKAINFIVDNLHNKEKLGTFLKTLNERYELRLNDSVINQSVCSSFLKTLSEAFGSDWTSELAEQWELTYQMVTSFFQDSKKLFTIKKSTELGTLINFPGSSTATCELPSDVKTNIREEARKTVQSLIQKEYQSALNTEVDNLTTESVKAVILKKIA
ncbi:MAG: hypothetical protein HQ462_09095 [Deltaproteobacteria bacterium]|nr:hypothetical protein [Deltaproteobacteria bacterium]